jgi:hypothetical protein
LPPTPPAQLAHAFGRTAGGVAVAHVQDRPPNLTAARRRDEPFGGAWRTALRVARPDPTESAILGAQRLVCRAAYYREPLPPAAATVALLRLDYSLSGPQDEHEGAAPSVERRAQI